MTLLDQAEQRLRSGKDDLTAGYGDPQGDVQRAFHQYLKSPHFSTNGGSMQTQQFEFGQPTYIALKFRTGQLVKKEWGDSVRYTLVNGKSAFFPVDVDENIKALNLGPRESFKVIRRREGPAVVWDIEREEVSRNGNGPEPCASANPEPVSAFGSKSTTSDPEPIRKPVATANLNTPQSQYIMRQLVAAIEVAAAAEKYALTALGRTVEFSHEDIRALAISGFIQQSREAA
jgi:hypothetical protein